MAIVYIPDELITKIHNIGEDKSEFIKTAIKEKLWATYLQYKREAENRGLIE